MLLHLVALGGLRAKSPREKGPNVTLSAVAVHHAKPRDREYKLTDERGLYLLVTPNGGKHWRFKYRFAGAERKLSFGSFPDVSFAAARERRDEVRRSIAAGTDPIAERRQKQAEKRVCDEEKFNLVADEWLAKLELEERAESTPSKMRWMVDFARPVIGHKLMAEITALAKTADFGNSQSLPCSSRCIHWRDAT